MWNSSVDLVAELRRPQVRVLELDRVDQVDAEIAVHRLVAQDVLVLLRGAGHLVLAAEREDLHEAHVEEEPFHHAREDDEALQQLRSVSSVPVLKCGIGERVDEGDEEVVLVADALHFLVGGEDLALVQAQRLSAMYW